MNSIILAIIAATGFIFSLSLIFCKKFSKKTYDANNAKFDSSAMFISSTNSIPMTLLKNKFTTDNPEKNSKQPESDFDVLEKIGYFIGAANDAQTNISYAATPLQDVDPEGLA